MAVDVDDVQRHELVNLYGIQRYKRVIIIKSDARSVAAFTCLKDFPEHDCPTGIRLT